MIWKWTSKSFSFQSAQKVKLNCRNLKERFQYLLSIGWVCFLFSKQLEKSSTAWEKSSFSRETSPRARSVSQSFPVDSFETFFLDGDEAAFVKITLARSSISQASWWFPGSSSESSCSFSLSSVIVAQEYYLFVLVFSLPNKPWSGSSKTFTKKMVIPKGDI